VCALFIGLSALGSLVAQNIASDAVLLALVAVLVSDLVALELAGRLWNREEAIARS
jgi:hypothetical protein